MSAPRAIVVKLVHIWQHLHRFPHAGVGGFREKGLTTRQVPRYGCGFRAHGNATQITSYTTAVWVICARQHREEDYYNSSFPRRVTKWKRHEDHVKHDVGGFRSHGNTTRRVPLRRLVGFVRTATPRRFRQKGQWWVSCTRQHHQKKLL